MLRSEQGVLTHWGGRVHARRRMPVIPAQAAAFVGGILLTVIGGVGLSRGGLNLAQVPLTHAQAAGLQSTSMSSLIQVVAGVVVLAAGIYPDTSKGVTLFFGVVLLAFGLIVAVSPGPFYEMWGYTASNGVFYASVGGALFVAGVISPRSFS